MIQYTESRLMQDLKQTKTVDIFLIISDNNHVLIEKDYIMKNFILGTIFGLVIATVGFSGIARILDHGVDKIKTQSVELAK